MTISFPKQKTVANIHTLSSPIRTLEALLHVYSDIIAPESLLPAKSSNARKEFLVANSLAKQKDKKFTAKTDIYKRYMEILFHNVGKLNPDELIFLDLMNYTLETPQGTFSSEGVDDFSIRADFPLYMMRMHNAYEEVSPQVARAMRNTIFWRLAPFDFPFVMDKDVESFIVHPLRNRVRTLQDAFLAKGKFALGTLQRYFSDSTAKANYKFSQAAFSIEEFNKQEYYLEFLQENTEFAHLPLDEFRKLNHTAITMNRELMKQKYQFIINQFTVKPALYMLEGDVGVTLLPEMKHIGGKLLSNIKKTPLRGVLETQGLNKLSGYFNARYGMIGKGVIFKNGEYRQKTERFTSFKHPEIKYLGKHKEVDDMVDRYVNQEDLALVKETIYQYDWSIGPIETVIERLNTENFTVHTETGETTWRREVGNLVIDPLNIVDLKAEAKTIIRPSNTGQACMVGKYISGMRIQFEGMGQNRYSREGDVIHEISNALKAKSAQKVLLEQGIEALARLLFCEVPLVHHYDPEIEVYEAVEETLRLQYEKTESRLFTELLRTHRKNKGRTIVDAGHPDGVTYLRGTDSVIVNDFKRRMVAGKTAPSYYIGQGVRYADMVLQGKGWHPDYVYVNIIQSPFHPGKFSDIKKPPREKYRDQQFKMHKIEVNGTFHFEVKHDKVMEHNAVLMLGEDFNIAYYARQLYKHAPISQSPSCNHCFLNDEQFENYQCRELFKQQGVQW